MLSTAQATRLRAAGFIEYEIQQFDAATTPDGQTAQPRISLSSHTWAIAIGKRYRWVQDQKSRGLTNKQIADKINEYYRKRGIRKRSPWDFIRESYKPIKQLDFSSAIVARRQAKDRIARGLGGIYKRA